MKDQTTSGQAGIRADAVPERLPVTLLTGFLGSGKTTILNAILRDPAFARTAVIVNEFGEIGLDHELVMASTDGIVLLQSGCMCCSLRGDLEETLLEMAERLDAGELNFDRVILETTGLSDPAPILHTLLTSRYLDGRFDVDGTVTTVDAVNGLETLSRHEEARRQVALAERILLTKTDLAEADAEGTRAALHAINPAAPVDVVVNGALPPDRLLGLVHFDFRMKEEQVARWLNADAVPRPGHGDLQGIPGHLRDIRSASWVIDRPVNAAAFDMWMEMLMIRCGADILRFKAILHVDGAPYPYAIHGVQHIFHPPVALTDWQGTDRRTKLVLILRDFSDQDIEDIFSALTEFGVSEDAKPVFSDGYLGTGMGR